MKYIIKTATHDDRYSGIKPSANVYWPRGFVFKNVSRVAAIRDSWKTIASYDSEAEALEAWAEIKKLAGLNEEYVNEVGTLGWRETVYKLESEDYKPGDTFYFHAEAISHKAE